MIQSEKTGLKTLESKPESVEKSIYEANREQSLGQLIHQKVDNETITQEIARILSRTMDDLGVESMPSADSTSRIIHYLVSYYRDLSLSEISKAFELAITGELNVNVEHYQAFNVKYICSILNAYKQRRLRAIQNVKRSLPLPSTRKSPDELKKIRHDFIEHLLKVYQYYNRSGELNIITHWTVYNFFLEEGIIHVSHSQWVAWETVARSEFRKQLSNPTNKHQRTGFREILGNFHNAIQTSQINVFRGIVKEVAVKAIFQQWKENDVDLKELITKKTRDDG